MIIGLSGRAGSGKDTVGNYLISNSVVEYKTGFAYFVKKLCADLFNIPLDDLYNRKHALTNLRITDNMISAIPELKDRKGDYLLIREVLQFFGTNLMRFFCPDVWVNGLFNTIDENDNVVIIDVRFPNEAKAIQDRGGKVIRLTRNTSNMDHESEIALDNYPDFDIIYNNQNESPEETCENLKKILMEVV